MAKTVVWRPVKPRPDVAQEAAERRYSRSRSRNDPLFHELPLNSRKALVAAVMGPVSDYLEVLNERKRNEYER